MENSFLDILRLFKTLGSTLCKICFIDDIAKIFFRGDEVKKSEIRLKSENLHPCQ